MLYRQKDWLQKQYSELGSINKMAALAGCHPRTIHKWMQKHGIKMIGMRGRTQPQEWKDRVSEALKGRASGMKGKKHSEGTRRMMSESRKGDKNANWKGGITAEIRSFRRSKEYVAWAKMIVERACGRCEECGRSAKLEAHHIISLHADFSKALDTDNGRALCRECHKKMGGSRSL